MWLLFEVGLVLARTMRRRRQAFATEAGRAEDDDATS
jgi:Sec-independent protein secretion pathway component TatC